MKKYLALFIILCCIAGAACHKEEEFVFKEKKDIFKKMKGKWKLVEYHRYYSWDAPHYGYNGGTTESLDSTILDIHTYSNSPPNTNEHAQYVFSCYLEFKPLTRKDQKLSYSVYGENYPVGSTSSSYSNFHMVSWRNIVPDSIPIFLLGIAAEITSVSDYRLVIENKTSSSSGYSGDTHSNDQRLWGFEKVE